ncbi:hypothetical protein DYBT9275_03933 [Dyadobacter sp. CECT 9275]|uniref:Uncharacterized protein n=1 Tax=Dyadobacter helix TaxID=2822344 RepID=A0A916JEC8_9BACT|nr:hypothetical protein [Dyadobacter sp. CECT 9275]CAG5006953.1 hypothetical protein DYBT9275_03933 [Dyadobacter sp. CECT 9275]
MPPLIAGVTLAMRKWGEGFGGWIGGFPWVAGPISFFMALENGPDFISSTTPSALLGSIGTFFFALIYSVASAYLSWLPTVLISFAAYFVVALLSLEQSVSVPVALGLDVLVLTGILYVFPKPKKKAGFKKQPVYDIPLRMFVATLFVVVLTQAADFLGPTWSGILTPFPVMTSTLAVFTHAQQGSDAAARVLYGLLLTGYGFVSFLTGVSWLIPHFPIGVVYGILVITTILINGITLRLIRN